LAGDQQIDLAAMVFIIGEALIDLRLREVRETLRRQGVEGLTGLKKSNNVVNTDPCAFHSCISAPDARRPNDVAIGFRNCAHDGLFLKLSAIEAQFGDRLVVAATGDGSFTLLFILLILVFCALPSDPDSMRVRLLRLVRTA
jgi:hypothetical protein